MYLLAYSPNWIIGSAPTFFGTTIWGVLFTMIYRSSIPAKYLYVSVASLAISIWCIPFLLHWSEKRALYNTFLQWCSHKELKRWRKLLNHLPVGVLVYESSQLRFASLSAHRLLLGPTNNPLELVHRAVERSDQLKTAITKELPLSPKSPSEDKVLLTEPHIDQIQYQSPSGPTVPLGVNTITLGLQDEPLKVCIIQDNSLYEELQKEKIAKQYLKKFFAMITHELRNPLHGVLGIFETFLSQTSVEDESKVQCKMGISAVKLMMRLVNDMLDLSQMEANSFRLVNEDVEIKKLIYECVELMQFKYKAKEVGLNYKFVNRIPCFNCDRNRYMQIVLNLLGNAIKFTVKGEVTIMVEYNSAKNSLYTTVSDTGIGIKNEDTLKLFSYFGKLEDHSAVNPQGVGLGLHICRKLCQAMGGDITLESEYLKGTSITFSIKNQLDPEEIKQEDLINPIPTEGSVKKCKDTPLKTTVRPEFSKSESLVLVVDDEFICINAVATHLKHFGYNSDTAITGAQAIELVKLSLSDAEKDYKVIFIDVNMPIKSGIETASEIRDLCTNHTPYIIGVTGDVDEETKVACKIAGMDRVVAKPLSKKDIGQLITELRRSQIL